MFKKIMMMLFASCLLFSLLAQAEDDLLLPGDTQMPTVRQRATAPTVPRMVRAKVVHVKPAHRLKKPHKVQRSKRHAQRIHQAKLRTHHPKLHGVKKHFVKKQRIVRGYTKKAHTVLPRHKQARHVKLKRHGHR